MGYSAQKRFRTWPKSEEEYFLAIRRTTRFLESIDKLVTSNKILWTEELSAKTREEEEYLKKLIKEACERFSLFNPAWGESCSTKTPFMIWYFKWEERIVLMLQRLAIDEIEGLISQWERLATTTAQVHDQSDWLTSSATLREQRENILDAKDNLISLGLIKEFCKTSYASPALRERTMVLCN